MPSFGQTSGIRQTALCVSTIHISWADVPGRVPARRLPRTMTPVTSTWVPQILTVEAGRPVDGIAANCGRMVGALFMLPITRDSGFQMLRRTDQVSIAGHRVL